MADGQQFTSTREARHQRRRACSLLSRSSPSKTCENPNRNIPPTKKTPSSTRDDVPIPEQRDPASGPPPAPDASAAVIANYNYTASRPVGETNGTPRGISFFPIGPLRLDCAQAKMKRMSQPVRPENEARLNSPLEARIIPHLTARHLSFPLNLRRSRDVRDGSQQQTTAAVSDRSGAQPPATPVYGGGEYFGSASPAYPANAGDATTALNPNETVVKIYGQEAYAGADASAANNAANSGKGSQDGYQQQPTAAVSDGSGTQPLATPVYGSGDSSGSAGGGGGYGRGSGGQGGRMGAGGGGGGGGGSHNGASHNGAPVASGGSGGVKGIFGLAPLLLSCYDYLHSKLHRSLPWDLVEEKEDNEDEEDMEAFWADYMVAAGVLAPAIRQDPVDRLTRSLAVVGVREAAVIFHHEPDDQLDYERPVSRSTQPPALPTPTSLSLHFLRDTPPPPPPSTASPTLCPTSHLMTRPHKKQSHSPWHAESSRTSVDTRVSSQQHLLRNGCLRTTSQEDRASQAAERSVNRGENGASSLGSFGACGGAADGRGEPDLDLVSHTWTIWVHRNEKARLAGKRWGSVQGVRVRKAMGCLDGATGDVVGGDTRADAGAAGDR
ncbi:hypothetical protein BDK51DRAFT_40532 [Blyttiomyces helicus]|uniref:Uncharacterized protein n=1 Tax=Blyttiomyces helicus TaxID=388810 RepID=A0A4P9WE75_9FUNG|nr:hypothetical protein BDK51DRAFT_40532 [Blyttiomyces helicus]|eukprot:RKO89548.1 hypothetical protein BDK51DRAFT_40532 [Blyttiomyces helicus]